MDVVETASALLIGNELLTGKVKDENLHVLATTLRSLGIQLRAALVVPDVPETLVTEIDRLRRSTDLVVTSGGVGPTHDDVTMQAVADAFGEPLVENTEIRALLERVYGERLTEGHLRMALVPRSARVVITNDVPWPTVVVQNVWIMPGVPQLFRMKLMALRSQVRGPVSFHSQAVYTKLDEGVLKPLLDAVVSEHPKVEVGSYPKWFDDRYSTKLTFDATSVAELHAAVKHFLELLPDGEPQWQE